MARKVTFKLIGLTPGEGFIYRKGNVQLVIYHNIPTKRYWPDINDSKCWKRDCKGMAHAVGPVVLKAGY